MYEIGKQIRAIMKLGLNMFINNFIVKFKLAFFPKKQYAVRLMNLTAKIVFFILLMVKKTKIWMKSKVLSN
jgi:hypothetical protein